MTTLVPTPTIRRVNGIPYGGGGGNTTVDVVQTAHGLVVGNLIRPSGNDTYVKAIATNENTAEIAGIVVEVVDVDNFTYAAVGNVIEGLTSLIAGTVYFLDINTAGGYSENPTLQDGEVLKPVLLAINTTTAILLTYAGQTYSAQILGTIAYQDANSVAITGGTITGLTSLGTDIICLTPISAPAHQEGCIYYDIDDKTPTAMTDIPDVRLQFCQESVIRVVNKSGVQHDNGTVLYFSGAQGNRPTVDKADADISAQAERLIGVATHNIANNLEGFATVFGIVRDINTSSWNAGDEIWLSQTAGLITNTRPPKGAHAVRLGFALNSANNGSIFINPYYGDDIVNLHDVLITTPANLDVLYYDNATGLWKNYALFTTNNNWSGVQNITNTTDCTAADTGALLVQGGAWFEKDVRSAGAIIVQKAINGAAFFLADSAGAFNFVSGTNNTGSNFVGCPTGGVFVGSAAAAPTYIVYNQNWLVKFDNGIADFIGSVSLTANLYVNGTNDCTAADTGALQVQGGAWIEKKLQSGGSPVFGSELISGDFYKSGEFYRTTASGSDKILTIVGKSPNSDEACFIGFFYNTTAALRYGGVGVFGGSETIRFYKDGDTVPLYDLRMIGGKYHYLRGDASTDGSVRVSSQESGVAIKEIRKSGAWVVVDSTDGCYAEIHLHDASTSQSIPNGATYTKTTLFTDNGLSSNCTADVANDKITITRAGRYRVTGSFSFTCGTNNVVWKCSAFIGGTESNNIHWERKVGTGSDIGSASFSGFADIAANTDIDVRFAHDQGVSVDLTLVYANLNVEFVGNE